MGRVQGCHSVHNTGTDTYNLNKRLMDKETRNFIFYAICFALGLAFGLIVAMSYFRPATPPNNDEVERDTAFVVIRDTIHDTLPPIVKTRYLHDTIFVAKDTAGVEHDIVLPITQNFYKKDGLYEAWVSGYNPMLDSIHVLRQKDIVTITNEKTIIQNKWRIEAQGGFFAHSSVFLPSIGISISAPKKWSCSANMSIPYKGEPIYSFSIGYSLFDK